MGSALPGGYPRRALFASQEADRFLIFFMS
jgi:hypothetical protein